MRVVITGATGNVGTSVIAALVGDPAVSEVVGVARRRPAVAVPKVLWQRGEVSSSDLVPLFRRADAVVHLAWVGQPVRQRWVLERINVEGSRRVFRAVAEAGVPALVCASSVGAYSAGPRDRRVDESWPVGGIAASGHSSQKARVERLLDGFAREHPEVRVVRLRTGLVCKAGAASSIIRRLLAPRVARVALRPGRVPTVPRFEGLALQAVHAGDAGEAYRLAVTGDARGAFNVVAEPVLDHRAIGPAIGARPVDVAPGVIRAAVAAAHGLRALRADPGWVDLCFGLPLVETSRAREVLGWRSTRGADEAAAELLHGLAAGAGMPTPPLEPLRGEPLPLLPSPLPAAWRDG